MPKVVTVTHIRNYNVLADSSALWQMFYCVRLPYGHVSNSTESQAIDLSSRMVDSSKTNPEDSSLQLPSSAPKRTPGDSVCSGLRCSKHFKTMFPMFCSCTRDTLSTPKKNRNHKTRLAFIGQTFLDGIETLATRPRLRDGDEERQTSLGPDSALLPGQTGRDRVTGMCLAVLEPSKVLCSLPDLSVSAFRACQKNAHVAHDHVT